jgi:hypothetical protein
MEEKLWSLFLTLEHLILLVGIFAFLLILRWMGPVKRFLFSAKWKWLIAPLNLVLSTVGVFALGLTSFTTMNMKVVLMLVASALVTFTYEAVAKHVVSYLEGIVQKKLGKGKSPS